MDTAFFFAYGTLMRGECRPHYLEGQCEFIGSSSVPGTLVNLGEYPGLVLDGRSLVKGELFRMLDPVTLLPRLDAMEGDEYERLTIDTGDVSAWVYRVRDPHDAPIIPSGDWRTHQDGRSKTATATRPSE